MWDHALPSLLIGLREGLEGGLIVTILVATLVRAGARSRVRQVWMGVLAALALSFGFGAVLTFTAANLSTGTQEVFSGALSLVAVAFVTVMVFWMRRSARTLSTNLAGKVGAAMTAGAGVMVATSFLAVFREGLETALFWWAAAQAAGESAGPLIGAALGLGLAVVLCWGLYWRVLKINLTRFFTITAIGLIVVAAGVVGEGVRDLQEGRVLPGGHAYAVDLVGIINPGSWYATLMAGVLNLTPQMTWLQVLSYAGYLVIVTVLFVRAVRTPATSPPDAVSEHPPNPPALAPQAAQAQAHAPQARAPQAPQARRPGWVLPVALAAVPAAIATGVIAVAGGRPAEATTIPVSSTSCGDGFTAPAPGRQTFLVRNTASAVAEVYLIDPGSGAVYGEIEGLAPGVTRGLVVTIGSGQYAWRCVVTGADAVTSATVRVATGVADVAIGAVLPVSQSDLAGPLRRYRAYVTTGLTGLTADVRALQGDVHSGDLDAARHDWLTAHQRYARLGAAYGTFAEFDAKINGRADGLPGGVDDPGFTGFGRLEYGLWHGQSAAALTSVVDRLAADVAGLQAAFPGQDFDPADLPLRTHEVLENTLQFELTGDADQGSGTALATAQANLAGTRELLAALRPLLSPRDPALLNRVDAGAARLDSLLASAHSPQRGWTAPARLDPIPRARINGATGQLLEDLAHVPALLEIRTTG